MAVTKEYLEGLPLRTINWNGQKVQVRYDADFVDENGKKAPRMYRLNEYGEYTGKNGTYLLDNDSETQTIQEFDQEEEPENQPNITPLPLTQPEEDNDREGSSGLLSRYWSELSEKKKNLILIFGIVAAVAAAILILITALGRNVPEPPLPDSTSQPEITDVTTVPTTVPTEPETEPTEAPTTEPETQPPTEPQILALTAAETLLPGHCISAENFTLNAVTESELRLLSANGGIYTEGDMAALNGLYVKEYISQGEYISYDKIGLAYLPQNPWGEVETGKQLVYLPYTPDNKKNHFYIWGDCVNATVSVLTKQTAENPTESGGEGTPAIPGMEHQSSIVESMVTDTYIVQGVLVADIKDSNGQSLFTQYCSLATIPTALKKQTVINTVKDLSSTKPAYIGLIVTKEQAALLNGLDTSTMTVTMTSVGVRLTTAYQNEVYEQLSEIAAVLRTVWPAENGVVGQ